MPGRGKMNKERNESPDLCPLTAPILSLSLQSQSCPPLHRGRLGSAP